MVRQERTLRSAAGVEPPSWPQFVNRKQTFAFNTFSTNKIVFKRKLCSMQGGTAGDEERPYIALCYSLSDHQYFAAQAGESFTKPECPLVTLRDQVDAEAAALTSQKVSQGWRAWA